MTMVIASNRNYEKTGKIHLEACKIQGLDFGSCGDGTGVTLQNVEFVQEDGGKSQVLCSQNRKFVHGEVIDGGDVGIKLFTNMSVRNIS